MGIEIDLGHNYLLTSDGVCFTLHKLSLNKNTELYDRSAIGYYTDIGQVFEKFANHRIMTSNSRELSVVADMMAEIKASIEAVLTINASDLNAALDRLRDKQLSKTVAKEKAAQVNEKLEEIRAKDDKPKRVKV